jgi:hypothetical protein
MYEEHEVETQTVKNNTSIGMAYTLATPVYVQLHLKSLYPVCLWHV